MSRASSTRTAKKKSTGNAKSKPVLQDNSFELITSSRNRALDSLRGIFALMVVFSHIELIAQYFDISDSFTIPVIFQLGRIGVTGFFCLSGFLITLHLLKLKERAGETGGKKLSVFYGKRILRIWPLYYAIVLLSIYVFPKISALEFHVPTSIGLVDARPIIDHVKYYFFFFLPQLPISKMIVLPFAEPTWSIGVEEAFYLVIPLVILFTNCRIRYLIVAIVLLMALKLYLWRPEYQVVFNFFTYSRFECILPGCIAAILVYRKSKVVLGINKLIFVASLILLFCFTAIVTNHTFIYLHFAILFAIMIPYIARIKTGVMASRWFAWLGTISFSLYMTHEIAIVLTFNNKWLANAANDNVMIIFPVAIATAVLLAFVTYKLIEEPFMKLKNRVGRKKVQEINVEAAPAPLPAGK